MKRRDFGQYCGLARALELVGERWALLIVRDLAVAPCRYTDLLEGLPGIPTNVLATRLKELERVGLIERRVAPAPQRGIVYALTAEGRDLEPVIHALGRWGTTQLGEPRPGEIVTPAAVVTALRAGFNTDEAAGLTASWELHLPDDKVFHATVDDGQLDAGIGSPVAKADLVITFTSEGVMSYEQMLLAAGCGLVELDGQKRLLSTFVRAFTPPGYETARTAA